MKNLFFGLILFSFITACNNSTEVHNRELIDESVLNSPTTKLIVVKTYSYPSDIRNKYHQIDSTFILDFSGKISFYYTETSENDYYYKKLSEKNNNFDILDTLNEVFVSSDFVNYPIQLPINIDNIGTIKDLKYIIKIYWRQKYNSNFKIIEDIQAVYEKESKYPENYQTLLYYLNKQYY